MGNSKFAVPYIFGLVTSFFIFQLILFVRSFPAVYNIYLRYIERMQTSDPFWTSFWFASELVGQVGFILRFIGACFLIAFTLLLLIRRKFILSYLKRAVPLEGIYYLFILPFILSLFLRPNTSLVNILAGLSYTLQILLITPAFLILYIILREPSSAKNELFKWGAIVVVGFTFALWIKHFLLNLYALPVNFENPILIVGFLNSMLTIMLAGLILLVAFIPIIRKKSLEFNYKAVGVAFVLIGLYFVIYIIVSLFIQRYMDFLMLTELWAIAFIIPGIGYIIKNHR